MAEKLEMEETLLEAPQEVIDLETMRHNLDEIVDRVADDHTSVVIDRGDKSVAVLVNLADYQEMQERLLAAELQEAVKQAFEEDAHGEMIDLEDFAAELGVELTDNDEDEEEPEGYRDMIPKEYRDNYN